MFRMVVSLSSSVSFSRVDIRRNVMPRKLIVLAVDDDGDGIGDGDGGRETEESAIECRREMVAAAAP